MSSPKVTNNTRFVSLGFSPPLPTFFHPPPPSSSSSFATRIPTASPANVDAQPTTTTTAGVLLAEKPRSRKSSGDFSFHLRKDTQGRRCRVGMAAHANDAAFLSLSLSLSLFFKNIFFWPTKTVVGTVAASGKAKKKMGSKKKNETKRNREKRLGRSLSDTTVHFGR